MASASCDKTVKLWDTATWQQIGTPLEHPNKVQCCCLSSDGRLLATGSDDKDKWRDQPARFLHLDMETKTPIAHLPAQRRGLIHMVYSEPLRQFLASNARGVVERCDVSGDSPQLLAPLEFHVSDNESDEEHNGYDIAIAPDGLRAAVTRADGHVDCWNLTSEQCFSIGRQVSGRGISFMPDGRRLLFNEGGWDGRIVVWNCLTNEIERTGTGLARRQTL